MVTALKPRPVTIFLIRTLRDAARDEKGGAVAELAAMLAAETFA